MNKRPKPFSALVDLIEVDEQFLQYLDNKDDIQGLEINNTNIRIWIHDQDLPKLEKVVWDGFGQLLLKHTSGHSKVRKFLESVPRLLNDIKEVHTAAIYGEVESIDHKEYRQQIYAAKDVHGISALHKAVINGNRSVSEYLLEKTDRSILKTSDRDGRTALHYAAAFAVEDDQTMFNWLVQMGADKLQPDNMMKTAEYYLSHSGEIDLTNCNSIPDAPIDSSLEDENVRKVPTKRENRGEKSKNAKVMNANAKTTKAVKVDKSLYTGSGKQISSNQVANWIKMGDVDKLEYATIMGKGRFIVGKPSWNDETRRFILSVSKLMADIETLHESAKHGELKKLKEILHRNVKNIVFARDEIGRSAIHFAAAEGHIDIVKHLVNLDPETCKTIDDANRGVLHYASRCANLESRVRIMDLCVSNGADKFSKDLSGNLPEYYLIHGLVDDKGLESAYDFGISVDVDDDNESPAVEKAIEKKDFDTLVRLILEGESKKLLSKNSADDEMQEFLDYVHLFQQRIEILHDAVEEGSLKELQRYLNRKKYALARDPLTGATLLHKAVIFGHLEIVKFLGQHFPEVLVLRDNQGRTPLHYAGLKNGENQFYNVLLGLGADGKTFDNFGHSAKDYLSQETHLKIKDVMAYVKRGGRLRIKNRGRGLSAPANKKYIIAKFENESLMIIKSENQVNFQQETDLQVLRKLEGSLRRLTWSRDCKSSLKMCLTKNVFDVLKSRKTNSGANLYDIIQSGIENLDSKIGIYAADVDSYRVFRPLFQPIIYDWHSAKSTQPESDWNDPDHLICKTLDNVNLFSVSVSRSIAGYPMISMMTLDQLNDIEKLLRNVFKNAALSIDGEELAGIYYPLTALPKEVERHLSKEGFLFQDDDKYLQSAKGYNHWPNGRGVFINRTRDAFIWINQSDHLCVTALNKAGNISQAFTNTKKLLTVLSKQLKFERDPRFGYVTFDPGLVGTGLRARAQIKLSYLSKEQHFLEDVCSQRSLSFKLISSLKDCELFEIANIRTFGQTEANIVSDLFTGVNEILNLDSRYKPRDELNHDLKSKEQTKPQKT